MDDRGATHLLDLTVRAEPVDGRSLGETTSSLYLIVLRGDVPGRMIRLGPGIQTIGRGQENRISVPDMSVSRVHARLLVDDVGRIWLTDDGSTNGTYLNGQRLTPHQAVRVCDGDRISLGPSVVLKCLRTDPLDERHHREMFERSVRDPLTGLYNRGYFVNQVDVLAQQVFRGDLGLAILMIDIDHFKRINDQYGHTIGDAVLREMATRLRLSTRADDLVARYGGEEFVAALPIASPTQALDRGRRIWQSLRGQPVAAEGQTLDVTASVGIAYAPCDLPRPTAALIAIADKALYRAKERGRDRVCYDDGLTRDTVQADASNSEIQPGITTVDVDAYVDPVAPEAVEPANLSES
ncbi:MAG: hypothetical protein KatS3mg108_2250 [Isosphaeraceae bacterium]|jgi:diguanylate cyclase (GGDEF)-like protein|nr:MAG: hypothetical protein KatS3mg108_2250 [Isosphaeraceae bacterium]